MRWNPFSKHHLTTVFRRSLPSRGSLFLIRKIKTPSPAYGGRRSPFPPSDYVLGKGDKIQCGIRNAKFGISKDKNPHFYVTAVGVPEKPNRFFGVLAVKPPFLPRTTSSERVTNLMRNFPRSRSSGDIAWQQPHIRYLVLALFTTVARRIFGKTVGMSEEETGTSP